jgi:uncharacterized protein (UPF0332 family)
MRNEIEAVIDKSRRAIKSAKREYKAGEYDYACSRAYYAAFYLLEGVLLLDKKRFTKKMREIVYLWQKRYLKQYRPILRKKFPPKNISIS